MDTLTQIKAEARKAAFQRRKAAYEMNKPGAAGHLSEVLAGYRGVPLSGYMPIRTEIDPLPAMAEAAAHGPVCVPVIQAKDTPLKFSRWQPDGALRDGPFGAKVPEVDDYLEPEILIVPLVAFDAQGGRLGYGGGFYDRTLELLRGKRATLAIGFAFDAQEADDLPLEPTDQPLDMLITESRVLQFSR
ncbi:5-formyltetrahydrofolate cyclo-ligase [Phaeobacter gallaeciensis]|uniref:5-formyltetrahydrofolate cyclo-ligase n=1 Tax=Phaeobacter gallaeciensis TaxID=60890 RepID=A0AAC9Z874_9RHOB|nr:5-formyltetrahydrofolate cyclo-ligase [Phaeobacter gallaeciensis]AHD08987.1 5-formyltetrahydrofolate cyclo-ligase [Phaeobacter gallaeciensis DSM 26640]ATE92253.1 5-formyltetrahydrofolate cycloligase-like protein [Phaeobacter gallaeciensis]ATE97928.1 5-formyltetrahydrofolate cycloligase-like protein [Phaeobacter gallaeciensis]ATF00915.1 5-formyltetrahydrofolate cycloligase-like protein [Phaeobacter gallaeciensis]ATF05295.1 5-formyltetrahydrofolate cycloligase-like protein [Phaeobacter gallae